MENSPLPIIDALPALNTRFSEESATRIGLLGTRGVMESRLFGGINSVELVLPKGEDLDRVHENYIAMAVSGEATIQQKDFFLDIARRLNTEHKADAIALAGTDLYLAFDGEECACKVLDCAQIHINALVKASLGDS